MSRGGDSGNVAETKSADEGSNESTANGQTTTEQGSTTQTGDNSQQGTEPQEPATAEIAEVNGTKCPTLQAAIDAAPRRATVKLLTDTTENVTISTPYVTLDLNGHTLNGSTGERKPALTVTSRAYVVDSSEAQTGTIMREDTAGNSGVSSHYVIDVQGKNGWLFFQSGDVKNDSGAGGTKGASLVRVGDDSKPDMPGMTISGGTFTQDNFIALKCDYGNLYVKGGTINSANSYAVQNWKNATIKDSAVINGKVSTWTYGGGGSDLQIQGGTVNGDIESVTYDGAEGKAAKVAITGGTVNGSLYTIDYSTGTTTDDPTKAAIEVTAGSFSTDPSRYLVEGSTVAKSEDGTFGVAKAYLAQVGETSYYTMDEAFKAQTKSGKAITLLRDYTTGSTFNSGTVARVVDLNGHTWTCTGTDASSAAFEINYANASLTVKNGKVVSSQLIGLIPSAMGGTIKYDNSTLTFDGVEASTTATSGIETNGNNTNDAVILKNSTLNVPNGFGIYFPSSGTLTIDNSKINAKTMGAQVCSGSLNVNSGSTITVSGDPVAKTENDGAIQDGAAISIVNRSGYKSLDKVAITGGTFSAKAGNAALKAYAWDSSTKQETAFDNSAKTVAVSGGTFSSAISSKLCTEGFSPVKNEDGTYDVKEDAEGYVEDESGNVTISTAEGLFYFAKKVNAGNNFAGKTVTLANNIDLNNEKWTPIGIYDNGATHFKGTFDGQNHAVTGLKVKESNERGVGFFGKVYTGTIKNLTVEGSVNAPGCNYVGGIVGHGYATITNCTFKGTVVGDGAAQVGGIAGSGGFTVDRCSVYGDVSAGCWAGGIVGNCQDGGAYTNCYVDGVISAEYSYYGGGAAGITPVPLYPDQVISGCYSNTVVKVADEEVNCPIIAAYNNPLDLEGHSGGPKIYDNSWNKQKNSNDSYPIYAEKDGEGGVLMEGMTAARDNSLIMLEDDLNYVTGDLSKVRIVAGSGVTQEQINALAVASVGDSKYQSLTEAIDAAQNGQTVTLLMDVEQNTQLTINKNITLDLNGKAIKNTVDIWGDNANAILSITNGAKVTITGDGTIDAKENDCYTINVVKGDLTIENGTFYGNVSVVQVEEGTLSVKGGTFDLHQKWEGSSKYLFNCIDDAYANGSANVAISGGTFVGFDPNVSPEGEGTSYLAPGYAPVANGDGTYSVKLAEGAYLLQDYRSGDQTSWTYPTKDGMAFAGWYKDAEFKTACAVGDVEGAAYAKFVKISDLITFKGGSLRTDLTGKDDYSKTSLRFGYEMHAPEGSKIDFQNWGWYYKTPFSEDGIFHKAENYWRVDNNGVIANFVLSPIYKSGYQLDYSTVFDVTAQLAYITADGTSVKVKDQSRSRSVDQVAKAIQNDSFASADDLAYANGILGSN